MKINVKLIVNSQFGYLKPNKLDHVLLLNIMGILDIININLLPTNNRYANKCICIIHPQTIHIFYSNSVFA